MSIIDITTAGHSKLHERPMRLVPTYSVLTEDPTLKNKFRKFIAIKLDETQNILKMVCVETDADDDTLQKDYQRILNSTDKSLYKEIMLPWQRVIKIQSLIFRQK